MELSSRSFFTPYVKKLLGVRSQGIQGTVVNTGNAPILEKEQSGKQAEFRKLL